VSLTQPECRLHGEQGPRHLPSPPLKTGQQSPRHGYVVALCAVVGVPGLAGVGPIASEAVPAGGGVGSMFCGGAGALGLSLCGVVLGPALA
jgi:hypothetical protein